MSPSQYDFPAGVGVKCQVDPTDFNGCDRGGWLGGLGGGWRSEGEGGRTAVCGIKTTGWLLPSQFLF